MQWLDFLQRSSKLLPPPTKRERELMNIPSEFSLYLKNVWRKKTLRYREFPKAPSLPFKVKKKNLDLLLTIPGWTRSHRRPSVKRANRPASPGPDPWDPTQQWDPTCRNWEFSLKCVAVTSYAPCSKNTRLSLFCHCLSTMKIQLNLLVRHDCWQLVASLGINARIDSYMLLQGQMLSLRPDGMLYFSTRPLLCCKTADWKGLVGFRKFTPKIGCPSNQS